MSVAPSRPTFAYPEPGERSAFEAEFVEYMAMPECNRHFEVVEGVIHVRPGPTPHLRYIQDNLLADLPPGVARAGRGQRLAGEYAAGQRLVSAALPGIDLDIAARFN